LYTIQSVTSRSKASTLRITVWLQHKSIAEKDDSAPDDFIFSARFPSNWLNGKSGTRNLAPVLFREAGHGASTGLQKFLLTRHFQEKIRLLRRLCSLESTTIKVRSLRHLVVSIPIASSTVQVRGCH